MTAVRLDRRTVVRQLLADRGALLAVSGLGSATYDLAACGDEPTNFYLWGAMGISGTIALGIALAQPSRPVLVLTGDGDMLMGLGSLATIGAQQPANLSVVVLDNERYGETGQQKSHTGHGVDLAAVATACRFKTVLSITDMAGVDGLARRLHAGEGPLFALIKVDPADPDRVLPPRDGAYLRSRFRAAVVGTAP